MVFYYGMLTDHSARRVFWRRRFLQQMGKKMRQELAAKEFIHMFTYTLITQLLKVCPAQILCIHTPPRARAARSCASVCRTYPQALAASTCANAFCNSLA